jgi:predicted RNA-binding Zn-ribbon protein involved in translation (DUF1610 family)
MTTPLPSTTLRCTQCGGELHPDQGRIFLTCPFCSSTVYLDKSRVVFHWYLAPTLDETRAQAALARWMAGNQTVKDLDQKARLVSRAFAYFPLWYFKSRAGQDREQVFLQPAAATSVSELKQLNLPAGDLRKYVPDLDAQSTEPSVPLQAALQWLSQERQLQPEQVAESALVHLPVYTFKYQYNGQTYTALVEAATGRTLANLFPAKAEAPYQLAGGLSAAVFLSLALIPLGGALAAGAEGLGIGAGICLGLGVLAAPVLFLLAAWVAAKV